MRKFLFVVFLGLILNIGNSQDSMSIRKVENYKHFFMKQGIDLSGYDYQKPELNYHLLRATEFEKARKVSTALGWSMIGAGLLIGTGGVVLLNEEDDFLAFNQLFGTLFVIQGIGLTTTGIIFTVRSQSKKKQRDEQLKLAKNLY